MDSFQKPMKFIDDLLVPFKNGYVKMSVRSWAPSRPTATLFLLHGYFSSSDHYDLLGQYLTANNIKLVAPDLPGRGLSAFLKSSDQYNLHLYFQCLKSLRKYVEGRAFIGGTEWGCFIMLTFLKQTNIKLSGIVIDSFDFYWENSSENKSKISDFIDSNSSNQRNWDRNLETNIIVTPFKYDLRDLVLNIQVPVLILSSRDEKSFDANFMKELQSKKRNFLIYDRLTNTSESTQLNLERIIPILGFINGHSI